MKALLAVMAAAAAGLVIWYVPALTRPSHGAAMRGGQAPAAAVVKVLTPVKQDVSPVLSTARLAPAVVRDAQRIVPNRKRLPGRQTARLPQLFVPDPALQISVPIPAMPAPLVNFEGVNNRNGVLPPDTNGDIGPNHYVQWVNLSLAVYDRQGNLLLGPANGNTLWAGFGAPCETYNSGDPIVLYDQFADRWLMSQFALQNFPNGPFYQCLAVSTSGDPAGTYYRYAYAFTKMNDYPHFGVWPDGYYMAINQFRAGSLAWGGQGVAVFDRQRMLAGAPATMQFIDYGLVDDAFGAMLPSDADGTRLPPAGSPNYFVEVDDDAWGWASDRLQVFAFHVDWAVPANTTFSGPHVIDLETEGLPFDAGASDVVQPGTTARLDALADRLMYRLAYRNFGTHESLVVNHTVNVGGGRAGVRWYELRNPSAAVLHQAGTWAPADGLSRWMGSLAQDARGNMALGYSVSGTATFPSIRYVGRLAFDPPGTMGLGETELIAGSGAQTHGAARWGDYSMMAVDPLDDCTFWYTNEYLAATSLSSWRTRVGSFMIPGCEAGPQGRFTGRVHRLKHAPVAGARVSVQEDAVEKFAAITGADGTYQVFVEPGTYDLVFSAADAVPLTKRGRIVADGETTSVSVTLQRPGSFVGAVTERGTGTPLEGALVELQLNGSTLDTAETDEGGQYTFTGLKPARGYVLTFSADGYRSRRITRGLPDGGVVTVNGALLPVPDGR
jgi:hypothetical protein